MKNVCIVGYGAIGPVHASAIAKTENARLYAVCDINSERLAKSKEKYTVKAYTDFDLMLKDENIDSVHICTPHYLHFEMIKKTLNAGKAVVCEKPITMTEEEYYQLLSLDGADKVCVVFQNRLNPCIERLKQIIDSGELGQIKSAKGILTWNRTPEYYNRDKWRGSWETEGGGVLINQAVHTLDFFSYLVGNINSVKAIMANFSLDEIEVEDTFSAYLSFENSAKGVFFATNAYGENSAPEFEIVFEKGRVRYIDTKLYFNGEIIEKDVKPTEGKAYWGIGHEKLIRLYYDNNKFFSPFDAKNTMQTMFAMYRSAKANGNEILTNKV